MNDVFEYEGNDIKFVVYVGFDFIYIKFKRVRKYLCIRNEVVE